MRIHSLQSYIIAFPTLIHSKGDEKMTHKSLSLKVLISMALCAGLWLNNASALVEPVKIGNPSLAQFPNNDPADCFARCVWDMHCYDGSIYVGSGDYWNNRGPIDVWAFDTGGNFKREYTVDEEQVENFREYEGKLFIPGIDSTESWNYGNLYIKDNGEWRKLRTIPRGVHVLDVALFEGNVYVTISSDGYSEALESSDSGHTWKSLLRTYWDERKASLGAMVALNDSLIILGTAPNGRSCVYRYSDGRMETLIIPLSRSARYKGGLRRPITYKNGLLYITDYTPYTIKQPSPLFFLNDFNEGATAIEKFRRDNVRDVVVRNDNCYVLTASETRSTFQGCIYSSSDLVDWTKLAEFSVPALPYSFEILDGIFYVGLGSRSFRQKYTDVESGSIYKIDPSAPLLAADLSHKQKGAGPPAAPERAGAYRALYPNYPNPFNPDTWIPYQLGENTNVVIRIYNTTGQLIRILDLGHKRAGLYKDKDEAAYWNGANEAGEQVASGVYIYTINAGDFAVSGKMLMAK